MKKALIITLLIGVLCPAWAQSDADVLRYSLMNPLGSSARSIGLGGAMGSVGADPSVVLNNPASLAQYKSNAFNISLGMNNVKNSSDYLNGNSVKSNRYSAEIPSINLVFTERKMRRDGPATTGWVNYNFGIGWNKTADFNRRISYSGTNTQNSMLNYVADYVQGLPSSQLDANDEQLNQGFYYFENMFWYAYLIDTISDQNYTATIDPNMANFNQSGAITTSGGMNELNFSFAANYEHKLYFGFGVNVHSVDYRESNRYTEFDNPLTLGTWNSYDFSRNLETDGLGYSGRLGLVFRPSNQLRLGMSLHSPTVLNLTDYYSDELYVVYDDGSTEDLRTIDKEYSYTVVTPLKYALQASYFFGKRGFVSAEIENVDYSSMNIYADDYDFEAQNETIAGKYTTATNLKLGAEYAINEFRLRAGFSQLGNPFEDNSDFSRRFASLGFGLQERTWGFDLGIVKELQNDVYVPYAIPGTVPNAVNSEMNNTRIVLTLATKF